MYVSGHVLFTVLLSGRVLFTVLLYRLPKSESEVDRAQEVSFLGITYPKVSQ